MEGLCQGIDEELVRSKAIPGNRFVPSLIRTLLDLGQWVSIPTTYAGGAKGDYEISLLFHVRSPFAQDLRDLDLVNRLSNGKVDLTYGRCVYDLSFTLRISIDMAVRWISSAEIS